MTQPLITGKLPARQRLMEIMMKVHLVSTDFANFSIGRMSDAEVEENLAMYRKQGHE